MSEATAAAPAAPAAAPAATTIAAAPAAATAAAPAAAPAAPGAAAETGAFGATVQYEPSGHAGLDIALGFLGRQGIGPDHPALVAARDGNFAILKAALAEKNVPGWEQHVALGEEWFNSDKASKAEAAAATAAVCVDIAGSAEDWTSAMQWAAENAEPEEKTALNTMLAAGGIQAQAAALFLVHGFRNAPGTSYEGKAAVSADAGSAAPAGGKGPLDGRAYGTEVAALRAKLGNSMESSKEYADLKARRLAFRG